MGDSGGIDDERKNTGQRLRFVRYPLCPSLHPEKQPGFKSFVEECLTDAEEFYRDADIGVSILPSGTATAIALARRTYSAIHNKIREGGYRLYDHRFRVPFSEKLAQAAHLLTPASVMRLLVVEMVARSLSMVATLGSVANQMRARYTVPAMAL